MTADVFLFTGIFAVLIGGLGCVIRVVNSYAPAASGSAASGEAIGLLVLPLICGVTLALLMAILIGRLRTAHLREVMVIDIAYQGAAIILEDNNVQRLRSRLAMLIPGGIK